MEIESLGDEEIVAALAEYFKREGIRLVIFDLDDTLIDTNAVFGVFMKACAQYLAFHAKEEYSTVWGRMKEVNNEVHARHSVNPLNWRKVVEMLGEEFRISGKGILAGALKILNRIYHHAPELKKDVVDQLILIRCTHVLMAVLTHGMPGWTKFKMESRKLQYYFDGVFLVNVDDIKGAKDWGRVPAAFGLKPEEVMIVEDNVKGGLQAAAQAGIKHLVYVPGPWEIYSSGEVPPGTIVVRNGIGELVNTLLGRA